MSITYTNEYSVTLNPAGTIMYITSVNDEYAGEIYLNLPLYILDKNYKLNASLYVSGSLFSFNINAIPTTITCEIARGAGIDSSTLGEYNLTTQLQEFQQFMQTTFTSNFTVTSNQYYIKFDGLTFKQSSLQYLYNIVTTGEDFLYSNGLEFIYNNTTYYLSFSDNNFTNNSYFLTYNNCLVYFEANSYIDLNEYKTVDSNDIVHINYTNTTNNIVPIFYYIDTYNNNTDVIVVNKTITPLLNITYDLTTFNLPVNCQFTTIPQLVNADSATITLTGSLPAGLSFDNATGSITGIPTETINTSVTVTISKDGLTVDVPLTFNIVTATNIYQSDYVVDDGQIISPVNNVNYLNGVVTYNVNTPEGIIFNSSNLQIQINSLETQSILNISVTESLEHTTLQYSQTVTINKILTFVYPSNNINIPANNFTSVLIKPTVNRTNYNVTINSGTLPTGLSLLTNGNITNTNTSLQTGTYTIQVKCIDEINTITTTDLTINVVNSTDMYEYTSTNTLIYEINTSVNISPYKLLTGFNNTFTATNLPSFLNINNGVISGVVDSGVYVFSVECESANSDQTIVYNFVNEIKLIVRKSRLNVSVVANIVEYYS